MEGFILRLTKSVREDLIVKILTPSHYYTLYRFYGARHSILFTGRKIDFEVEYQGVYIPKLRNIMHLSRDYERDINKVFVWQQFCMLLDRHLDDTKELSSFYFNLLDKNSKMLVKQNAKRLVIKMYLLLLEFEGRLYNKDTCHICGKYLEEDVALDVGYLLACPSCVLRPVILPKKQILDCFNNKSAINLNDIECDEMYNVILLGL